MLIMNDKASVTARSDDPATGPVSVLALRAIAATFCRLSIWLTEHRKAQAAAHIVATLQRKSDADLAKLGIRRQDIADYVKARLYQ